MNNGANKTTQRPNVWISKYFISTPFHFISHKCSEANQAITVTDILSFTTGMSHCQPIIAPKHIICTHPFLGIDHQ